MENKKQVGTSLDHLFGPKVSSSSSSVFGSIYEPSLVMRRDPGIMGNQVGNCGNPGNVTKGNKEETDGTNAMAEPCYFSSSIYYGGQENYSPRTKNSESHIFKKDSAGDDANSNNSNSASRGNWWQGSLYY